MGTSRSDSKPVFVMTWNVLLGIQQGVPALATLISEHHPDGVALQEVGNGWIMGPPGDTTAGIAAAVGLPHHHHVVAIEDTPGARYGQSLLSRWPIEAVEVVDLPQEIDEPRKALVARLARPEGELRVVAAHPCRGQVHLAGRAARGEEEVHEKQRTEGVGCHGLNLGP